MPTTPYRYFSSIIAVAGATNPWTGNLSDALSNKTTSITNEAGFTPDILRLSGQDLSADIPSNAIIDAIEISVWCRCVDFAGVSAAANIYHVIEGGNTLIEAMPEQVYDYITLNKTVAEWGLTEQQAWDFINGSSFLEMNNIVRVEASTDRYYLNEYRIRAEYTVPKVPLPILF
jgi:hypothetical protein